VKPGRVKAAQRGVPCLKGIRIGFLFLIGLVVLAAWGWWRFVPSPLLKLLPAPHLEKYEITGRSHNGSVIDLQGCCFNDGKPTEIVIRSVRTPEGWEVPENLTIRNGRLRGGIRIMGLGANGEAPLVRESSHRLGHTGRAQAAAPRGIVLESLQIEADHRIPLYLGPGVTGVKVRNCEFTGLSASVVLYLDAESARNAVENCTFDVRAGREVLAVDGSADNAIVGNRFARAAYGGIYLYRNCGEGGTVRHQTPRENRIERNFFNLSGLRPASYGVWLGSRQGRRSYCEEDAGYDFGSSIDNRDFADDNTVADNLFEPSSPQAIRDDGARNNIGIR
jgi:hypothetical protein